MTNKATCDKVNDVRDFLLFKVIFEITPGKNQAERFDLALNELKEMKNSFKKDKVTAIELYSVPKYKKIFNNIKEMVSIKEDIADKLIKKIKKYFKLNGAEKLLKDLNILFKSKKYEMDLKSIIYFFECFPVDINWKDKLPKNYENLSQKDLEELKRDLDKLKNEGIYNYEDNGNCSKLFKCFYEKKEAIDFLLSKVDKEGELEELYNKLEPTNRTISINNLNDVKECVKYFKVFKKSNNFQILDYIKKKLISEYIDYFVRYSKNYSSIIELDRNIDFSDNVYETINQIITNANLIFFQDNEEFSYFDKKKITSMKNLIQLKNKIPPLKKGGKKVNKSNEIIEEKRDKLIFFKEIISNLEIIYDNMNILRKKGNNLPIRIEIKIKYPKIIYKINKKEEKFEQIQDFLFKAKTDYNSILKSIYKEKRYLRFLNGKLFRRIMIHLEYTNDIDEILRYILNNTDDKEKIKDGDIMIKKVSDDYVKHYNLMSVNNFENISAYISSLFNNNGMDFEKHYEKILIKDKNNYKGIYFQICENESMEEFILNIFLDKLGQKPISQNILICSKETSPEEIQAFFYRAILCDYNTLFVVEINESFNDYQQNIMNNYISDILSFQNNKYKKAKKNVDKGKTCLNLNTCIVFVCEKNNTRFLNEIKNQKYQEFGSIRKISRDLSIDELNDNSRHSNLENFKVNINNIQVITSEICGLGKSHEIRKKIKEQNKKYYHFPLGGILGKNLIFEKLKYLLIKIKKENGNNYENIAIHLDLKESKDFNVINEFLFSFLITKFYYNSEDIIYIPESIDVYVEIPNCFENYLEKFGILKIFKIEEITFDKMPKLDFSEEMSDILCRILPFSRKNLNSNLEKFIKKYIGLEKYSYHQVQIFIKLFISQYRQFPYKITILNEKENKIENDLFIKDFAECTKYFTCGGFAQLVTNGNFDNNDCVDLLSKAYKYDLEKVDFNIPLIFISKEKHKYSKLEFNNSKLKEYKSSRNYLSTLKSKLNLPNEVEKKVGDNMSLMSILNYQSDNYVITNDNFKKMVLLIYRIKANVPVILMGETGCGKTSLITKLSQILNNGKIVVEIINIHPGITDEYICNKMKEINKKAESQNEEIWVFFDEINKCLSLSLITEIFIDRTFNGQKLNDKIRLIGACNPYRKRKVQGEKSGLIKEGNYVDELVYLVQPLPLSLLYYVFSFGNVNEEDEKEYIKSIIKNLFEKDEKLLHENTTEAIFKCHKFLRDHFDYSIVSLREISRFSKSVEFFKEYYSIKDEYLAEKNNKPIKEKTKKIEDKNKLYKIKSIICSIYLCYYIRLVQEEIRNKFDFELQDILLNLVNCVENEKKEEAKKDNILDKINYKLLKEDLIQEEVNHFSDILKIEEKFLLDKIELDKGIGKNKSLEEIVFLLFIAVVTKIPLIIIGKPGTGKSLSAQLINKSMRGKYSKEKFFKKYPQIIQTFFQGSESTKPEDVEKLFQIAEGKYQFFAKNKNIKKDELPISEILFDEMGLSGRSESNPLEVLNSKLEYAGKKEGVSFIGISNYSLDASKANRAFILSVPNFEDKIDQLTETSKCIVESISGDLSSHKLFEILPKAYFKYKKLLNFIQELIILKKFVSESKDQLGINKLQFSEIKVMKEFIDLSKRIKKLKTDFHGNRDFYSYIGGTARDIEKLSGCSDDEIIEKVEKNIERNFGGIDYEIDKDLDWESSDIIEEKKNLRLILEKYNSNKIEQENIIKKNEKIIKVKKEEDKIKLSSVFLFKNIYNIACETNNSSYKIKDNNLYKYNINECINDNINSINSRYLLLEIKPSLSSLIYQNIKIQNPQKKDKIKLYEGSPFADDNNTEYRYKKVNEIQEDVKTDKIIILQNLNQIQPFLYDLYNMNYTIIDEQKYSRICLDNFNEQLTLVNNSFRIIILVDRKFLDEVDMAFLNRLEKMKITFDKLLNEKQKTLMENIIDEIQFKNSIEQKNINYKLKDLLINNGKEEIEGLIYNTYLEEKKENNYYIDDNKIKKKIYSKIAKMLPQDIICILPDKSAIKGTYYKEKKYYNFEEYITDEDNKKYKISIIYTFTSIASVIEGPHNEMKFMISEIRSESQLKNTIDEIINKNKHNQEKEEYNIIILFEQINSNKIQFVSNFILNKFVEEKYSKYRFIFIIHIKRNFLLKNGENRERIYSILDINPDINQLFIDNLNATNIKLRDFLEKDIKTIIDDNEHLMDLNREFMTALTKFVNKEINRRKSNNLRESRESIVLDEESYISVLKNYMNKESNFKYDIIQKAKNLISCDKEAEGNCKNLVDKLMQTNYIGKNSLDIISCGLDYIKEELLSKYLEYIFKVLEDNNILTTLIQINNNEKILENNNKLSTLIEIKNNNEDSSENIDEEIIYRIRDKYLKMIEMDNKNYEPKFLLNYKIPGFYNFYKKLYKYINNNIAIEFLNNENKIRTKELIIEKNEKDFQEKENKLLNAVYDEINNDLFILDIINQIPENLILKDYINFYLDQHSEIISRNNINSKLIKLLLDLRFDENKTGIIKNNIREPIKIFLIKIMWIEANINYIANILKICDLAKEIVDNDDILFKRFDKKIYYEEININYIANEKKNPEYTKEINECYYMILKCLIFGLTSDKIKLTNLDIYQNDDENEVEIDVYCNYLKEINIILHDLNNDLKLNLNEIYIIDELIDAIELENLKIINIENLERIRNLFVKSCLIIKKTNALNKDSGELFFNIHQICDLIEGGKIKSEKENYKYKYYKALRNIFYKEIKKIDKDSYQVKILEKILEKNDIIKKSNEIFQTLIGKYFNKDKKKLFENIINNLLNSNEVIIEFIDKNLKDDKKENYFALSETLLYFFEKNSLILLEEYLNRDEKETLLEREPLTIFEVCMKYLKSYEEGDTRLNDKKIYITKFFCLAYIKTFCFTFIKSFDETPKFNNPEEIIKKINKCDLKNIVKYYIYKILYNKFDLEIFLNEKSKKKYKLSEYEGFNSFIKFEEDEQVDFRFDTLDNDNYDHVYNILEDYKKQGFKEIIKMEEINKDGSLDIDNFFVASNKLILINLKRSVFEESDIYKNFYNNICIPLFGQKEKGEDYEKDRKFSLIKLLFDPKEYKNIKKSYGIINIESILYGYRYCLNELFNKNEENDCIYSSLYDKGKIDYLSKKYYPGSDTKKERYYELYNAIYNHFEENPNKGCFVCLCNDGFYHCVESGFPNRLYINLKCPYCEKEIGSIYKENDFESRLEIVKREGYYRIFKDEEEIKLLKENEDNYYKLNEINYMTLEEFKKKYILKLYKNEKGLPIIYKNYFKKDNKIIRKLSQISYRLLNYILYSHLFFAKLITKVNNFDNYLPKGMTWGETLNECWLLLKNELNKKRVTSIEKFMNYSFKDLFNKLHGKECIESYEELIKFEEDELEPLIKEKIEKSIVEIENYKQIINKNKGENKNSAINILKEIYDKSNYSNKEYPFYENFYYSNYLDEEAISG